MSMCRFTSRDDQGYKMILGGISSVVSRVEKKLEEAQATQVDTVETVETVSLSQRTTSSAKYCM